ncbi:MAG: radical SAM protein [Candidatus Omnitrophica bacterium]|nr:radical SAM protein [Candidatus Omnitrophota bacterium]
MKIALIQCPAWGRDCPPYTMALLSALYKNAGHEVFCFDLNNALYISGSEDYRKWWDDKDFYSFWNNPDLVDKFLRDNSRMVDFTVDKILASDAKLIGFTTHFSSYLASIAVAEMIKQRDRSRFIVFGGPEAAREFRGRELIAKAAVDAVAIGEGDETALELAGALDRKGYVDSCKGTLLKYENGRVVDCGDREVVEDLDSLPFPDYSYFSDEIHSRLYREPDRLDIFDSRGCITQCHFCSEWQFWKRFRSMSGERMFAEITHQMSYFKGINYFYFIGSLLNGSPKELGKLCDLIIQNKLGVRWAGQAVVSPAMTGDMLNKMRRAGCQWLGIGVESGSPKVVHGVNKKYSHENAEQMLRDAREAGISTQINIMFGIPGETESDFQMTLEFLKRVRPYVDSVLASQSFCVIDKGTYLHTHPEEFGIRDQDHHLYWEAEGGNTYPRRQARYEEFCGLALSLGLPETSGVLSVKPDKWLLLGDYHHFKSDYRQALDCYLRSQQSESSNDYVADKIRACRDKCGEGGNSLLATSLSLKVDFEAGLEQIFHDQNFNEKQRNIANALYAHKLWDKLYNFILIENEKARRKEVVSGYPYWLVIDPSNICNLKCPFCPTGQGRGSREKGVFPIERFEGIIDKLGKYLIHIDFVNWGEPLLNKQVFEMIKTAKKYRVDTKMDSNFTFFNEETAGRMIESGLDKVIVSLDGLSQETYSKYRVGGDFEAVMAGLKALLRKKKEMNSHTPYVSWQFLVFRHNEHEIERARALAEELGVDHIGISKAFIGDKDWFPTRKEYSNYIVDPEDGVSGSGKTQEYFVSPQDKLCNWPWETFVVNVNGSVSPCCSVEDEKDDFGNIFLQPFEEIWNNEHYRLSRAFIRDKVNTNGANICVGCRHLGLINLDIMSCHSFFGNGNKKT